MEEAGPLPFLFQVDGQKKEVNIFDRIYFQKGQKELDLSLCNLTAVPLDPIRNFYGEPTALNLSYNGIISLCPRFVVEMASLTKLDLSKNSIQKLPDDFGSLRKLVHLDLHQNKLETLPVSMSQLNQLQYLNISDNPLRSPLSNFMELEVVQKQNANQPVNVAHAVVKFLTVIAARTLEACGDTAERVQIDRKRSVTFDSEMAARDRARINEVFPDSDEDNISVSYPALQKYRDPDRFQRRMAKLRAAARANSAVREELNLRNSLSYRIGSVLKGVFCLFSLVLLIPIIVAMLVDHAYFDTVDKGSGYWKAFLEFYIPIHASASMFVCCIARLQIPLLIKGPVHQGIMESIFASISSAIGYIVSFVYKARLEKDLTTSPHP